MENLSYFFSFLLTIPVILAVHVTLFMIGLALGMENPAHFIGKKQSPRSTTWSIFSSVIAVFFGGILLSWMTGVSGAEAGIFLGLLAWSGFLVSSIFLLTLGMGKTVSGPISMTMALTIAIRQKAWKAFQAKLRIDSLNKSLQPELKPEQLNEVQQPRVQKNLEESLREILNQGQEQEQAQPQQTVVSILESQAHLNPNQAQSAANKLLAGAQAVEMAGDLVPGLSIEETFRLLKSSAIWTIAMLLLSLLAGIAGGISGVR